MLKEPLKQYAEIMQKSGLGAGFGSLELLPGGNGYRFSTSFRMADVMQGQTLSEEGRQGVALVAGMIPREMTTSVTIGGLKVENTNGSVSADGKSVTWKIPLHTIFDMRTEAEPLKMTADVYFK